jgi:hypothetical protein
MWHLLPPPAICKKTDEAIATAKIGNGAAETMTEDKLITL